jgi:formylglycine-generating enzyme
VLRGLGVVLAISASFSAAFACGKLREEVGNDRGGDDGTVGSTGDVAPAASNAVGTDATADSVTNGAVVGVASDAASGSDPGDGGPPSCAPGGAGMTNCGPGGSGTESCCTSLEVEGGTYFRTYENDGGGPKDEADPATVSDFRLDKYDVTVGRFRQFVKAWNAGAGYAPRAGSGKHTYVNGGRGLANSGSPGTYESGWVAADDGNIAPTEANLVNLCDQPSFATWTDSAGSRENLPINCENWDEAYAFCIWDGGFLPSEAEWEYAAAGGSQQLEYPWGTTPPGTKSQYAIYGNDYPSGSGRCRGVACIAPVGTATGGAGRWGQLDMAGEVSNWTLDYFQTYVDPCVDCAYLTATSEGWRNSGGGSFASQSWLILPESNVGGDPPMYRGIEFGLRCARTP